ncbi:anti-sigma factor [Mesorhizobium sp. KR9-304]|uniref:anti-sigma factor family protein n=1 Tax=Mesorhizobium sp. KR9-304 TaxID=3156614 RepID=UPI0032B42FC2
MTRRDFSERDIHMALDGELPQEERADYEAWLDEYPEMKARSVRFESDRARLRDVFADVLDERAPDRLTNLVTGEARRPTAGAPRWRMATAAALLLAIGAGGGYFAGMGGVGLEAQAEDELAEEAIAAHTIYAAEQRHAVEVGANDKEHLLGWLSKRLGLTLIAPDLTAEGFELVGGRLLPAGQKAAALLLYEDAKGNRISIYVTAEGEEKAKGIYKLETGDASAVYWLDKGWGCAVVGTLPQEQLLDVGRKAYRQMLAGAGMA